MTNETQNSTPSIISATVVATNHLRFSLIDYCVFAFMLLSCILVGIYFGFVENKAKKKPKNQNESKEAADYLVGGRDMSVLPIALSLFASWISGISLLGITTEVYTYGTQYMFMTGSLVLCGFAVSSVFLPVFQNLRLTSGFEYLELRFDKRIRLFASILYTISTIFYLPVVIYTPALALNQLTGINIHVITSTVCVVCIFYTLVGGIKAVVWTDTIQAFIMVGAVVVTIVKGTVDLSGFDYVWQKNEESGRIEYPEFTLDPCVRHSMISVVIGGTIHYINSTACNQGILQRFFALPSLKASRKALWIFVLFTAGITGLCCYSGMVVYAKYYDCDPLLSKVITSKDQLLPLFVMDVSKKIIGLPGIFVAGIFSAALSTLSTVLNSMAAVVLEDFVKPNRQKPLTERQIGHLMRFVVFFVGVTSVALVFVVEHLGAVLQLSMSLSSLTGGAMSSLFISGMMMPWMKGRGILFGGITAILCMAWIIINAQADIALGNLRFTPKNVSIDGCLDYGLNATIANLITSTSSDLSDDSFKIHHISYLYYTMTGAIISITVGSFVSLFYADKEKKVSDTMLYAPFVRRFIKPSYTINGILADSPNELKIQSFSFEQKNNQLSN